MYRLLITDLDDTLYSWMGFYVPAFYAMADKVSGLTGIPMEELLDEYRDIHQEKGTVEYPFSTLLLPSVQRHFNGKSREEIKKELGPAFEAFNRIREDRLRLFPGVLETLQKLTEKGIRIIGFTDSGELNGFYRLQMLGISDLFTKIYVTNYDYALPDYIERDCRICEANDGKPDPKLLNQIIQDEGLRKSEVIYMGDSLTKDIFMAYTAGVESIRCRFPVDFDMDDYYRKLVRISSWTEDAFQREAALKARCMKEQIRADHEISRFSDILPIIDGNA